LHHSDSDLIRDAGLASQLADERGSQSGDAVSVEQPEMLVLVDVVVYDTICVAI